MDLDRYLAIHRPGWERLEQLSKGGHRRARRLTGPEIAELVRLYQETSTALSYVRTYYRDPSLVAYLTRVVSRAGSVIYGTRPRSWRVVADFFVVSFPAAVYRARRFVWISAVFTFLPAILVGIWLAHSPTAANALMPPALREAYLNHDFQSYYQANKASQFASTVYTNNVGVAILAFAGGIFFAVPTVAVLIENGANLGFAAGVFTHFHEAPKFWGLVTPHGLVELSSVVIAGGAGLQVGWSLISPGDRRRSTAIAEEGRRAIAMTLGLVFSLAIAGTIEGFVTGQPWPTWLRVGIGVIAETLFVTYLIVLGRPANARGFTGALGETDDSGWAARNVA
jgi:uncharacterized membrane protein SpoIIM required for sporulation